MSPAERKIKSKFILKKSFLAYIKAREWTVDSIHKQMGYEKSQISAILSLKIEPSMRFLHDLCEFTNMGAEDIIETVFE